MIFQIYLCLFKTTLKQNLLDISNTKTAMVKTFPYLFKTILKALLDSLASFIYFENITDVFKTFSDAIETLLNFSNLP